MNKTIIININGIVFHIEEDAYDVLKSYMTEVKRHFAYSKDSDEIVTDIENRLAEMFSERLADQNKQVIVLADVQEITAQMGSASEFEIEDEEPASFSSEKIRSQKSLYKDPDDRIIGGVCSGLGHYFNMEAKWVRLIAVLATFTTGIPLIPYLILWIVLPEAVTRKDKMAMKGEALNLQNFKKSFDEEVEALKSDDNRANMYARHVNKGTDPIKEILNFIGRIIKTVIKVIGIFIVAVGACVLFGLMIALFFVLGFLNTSELQHFPFNAINPQYQSPIFFSAFLLIFIPLIALILFALRVILNRKIVSRYGSFAMLILWLTGLVMGGYYGAMVAAEFQEEATFEQVSELTAYPKLTLKLNSRLFFTKDDSVRYNISEGKTRGRILFDRSYMGEDMQHMELYIDKSDDGKFMVINELSGKGPSFEKALKAAQRISYKVLQQDSVITFDKYFLLKDRGLYRRQRVDVHLKIPVNTRLIIDGNLDPQLQNCSLWECRPENSDWETPTEWIMTEDGLKCADREVYEKNMNRR